MKNKRKAFKNGIPSMFFLVSPLQIICAYEAIIEFQIEDYYIIWPYQADDVRNFQMEKLYERLGLKYTKVAKDGLKCRLNIFAIQKQVKGISSIKYERIFIGDYRDLLYQAIALHFMKCRANFVYLDDGNPTISLLKNKINATNYRYKVINILLKTKAAIKRISYQEYLFSTYADIPSKKIVYHNCFNNLQKLFISNASEQNNLYFIGTNPDAYIDNLGIAKKDYFCLLGNTLSRLKRMYSNFVAYYIPHGRDNDEYTKKICIQWGFIYKKIDLPVELFLLENNIVPAIVAGFTSAALYNLKKMYQNSVVYNVLSYNICQNEQALQEYVEISNYYQKQNIILL